MTDRNNDRANGDRQPNGKFAKGNPGGPGRPRGEPAKLARAVREKWSARFDELATNILNRALEGDIDATRLVIERLYPKPRDGHLALTDMPMDSLSSMTGRIVQAVAEGEISPSEGSVLADVVAKHAKSLEIEEIESRLARLEEAQGV